MTKFFILSLIIFASHLSAGVNVLVIGSSEGFEKREMPKGHGDHLDLAKLAESLQKILNKGKNSKNGSSVSFEDIYRKKFTPVALGSAGRVTPTEFHCHSLAQYYFWPEGKNERLANLSNKGTSKWDYVVLVGDPYLMSEMPGIYAEGVDLLVNKIKEADAKIVLLMPWHSDKLRNKRVSEVAHRVGQGLKLPVAAAGDTWAAAGSSMESANSEYMAAASVFSALSGGTAWGSNPSQKRLAKNVLETLKNNKSKPPYSSPFESPNPFSIKYITQKKVTFRHTGSSSEAGIQHGLREALKRCAPSNTGDSNAAVATVNYGRGNSNFEPNKRYKVDPEKFAYSYGFPMQEQSSSAANSMLYGIDKRYFKGSSYDDGTDLGIAYDMIREKEVERNARAVPIRLLWAKLHDAKPELSPLRDKWHMSRHLDAATGSFMVTLLTGQNPVGDEPSDQNSQEWLQWLGRKIGYETAIRMGRLSYDSAQN